MLIVVKEDVTKSDTAGMNNLVPAPFTSRLTHYSCSRVGGGWWVCEGGGGGISTCHFPSVQRAASDPIRLAAEEERNTGQMMDTC